MGDTGPVFWLVVHDPGCVPNRKGPFPVASAAQTIREFIRARPTSLLTLLTVDESGTPHVEHAPEALQMLDGRSMAFASAHNKRVRAAFTPTPENPND